MTPALVRAALEAVITATTGIDAAYQYWKRRPRGMAAAQYVIMSLTAYKSRGRDAIVYDYDVTRPLGAELVPHQVGERDAVWNIQLWSHDATDTQDALSMAMDIADQIYLDEHRDALQAVDIGIADVAALVDLGEQKIDQRLMSAAQIDIRLNALSDRAGTALGYVETFQITGTADVNGAPVIFINDEVMP